MIREILKPTKEYLQIHIPKEYLNEEVEVIVFRVNESSRSNNKELIEEFQNLTSNIPKLESDIDLIKIDEDINSDIF